MVFVLIGNILLRSIPDTKNVLENGDDDASNPRNLNYLCAAELPPIPIDGLDEKSSQKLLQNGFVLIGNILLWSIPDTKNVLENGDVDAASNRQITLWTDALVAPA